MLFLKLADCPQALRGLGRPSNGPNHLCPNGLANSQRVVETIVVGAPVQGCSQAEDGFADLKLCLGGLGRAEPGKEQGEEAKEWQLDLKLQNSSGKQPLVLSN